LNIEYLWNSIYLIMMERSDLHKSSIFIIQLISMERSDFHN
jgi:hypothetical protein